MTTSPPLVPARLGPEIVTPALLDAVRDGVALAPAPVAVLDLLGPGAVACMQGLLTNDIEQPGDDTFVYGAFLTPKGMIVADGWVSREGTRVTFTVPLAARDAVSTIYRKTIPPRQARWRDRTGEAAVIRLVGPRARVVCGRAAIPLPDAPGRVLDALAHGAGCEVATAPPGAPFSVQITATPGEVTALRDALTVAGARVVEPVALELATILAGWPSQGREIDERTIPQEVRFDDIGGVSYTKGCYIGQETVSRLHFRGHTNRSLRGLLFDGEPAAEAGVRAGEREVGRVTSVAWIPAGARTPEVGRWVGLAILRREVTDDTALIAAGVPARAVDLPFSLPYLEPA